MASNTPNLNLLKKDPVADKLDTFNIQTMLNENWDKIDVDSVTNKNHRDDATKHVTSTDKTNWNNKLDVTATATDSAKLGGQLPSAFAKTNTATNLFLGSTLDTSPILSQANYGKVLTKTGAFTLSNTECNKILKVTAATTITIPQDIITVPDAQIPVIRDTSGVVNFLPSGTVTLKSIDTKRAIKGQNASATLIRIGTTNEWFLEGSLE